MQVGHSLGREGKHSITVLFLVSVKQLSTKHVLLFPSLASACCFPQRSRDTLLFHMQPYLFPVPRVVPGHSSLHGPWYSDLTISLTSVSAVLCEGLKVFPWKIKTSFSQHFRTVDKCRLSGILQETGFSSYTSESPVLSLPVPPTYKVTSANFSFLFYKTEMQWRMSGQVLMI